MGKSSSWIVEQCFEDTEGKYMMDQNRRPEPLGTREKWGWGEGLER